MAERRAVGILYVRVGRQQSTSPKSPREPYGRPSPMPPVHRETIVVGLAAVMGGMTAFMLVVAVVVSPFFFLLSVPFGGAAYVMWQHATGRLAFDRARASPLGGVRFGPESPEDPRRTRTKRSRRAERNRSRAHQSNGTTSGSGTPMGNRLSKREAVQTLGIEPDASTGAIRRAYRRRAKEAHPDTDSGSSEEFKRVNRAYERLREE